MRDSDARADWSLQFARTIAEEIRSGVRSGALTWAEADELLARMRVLIDQALERAPQFS